jgi:hypothetical protein
MLKAPGSKRLKRKYDIRLSSVAFKFNLRRYTVGVAAAEACFALAAHGQLACWGWAC